MRIPKPMRAEEKSALEGPSNTCDALVIWIYNLGGNVRCDRLPVKVEEGYSLCQVHDKALNNMDLKVMKPNSNNIVTLFVRT